MEQKRKKERSREKTLEKLYLNISKSLSKFDNMNYKYLNNDSEIIKELGKDNLYNIFKNNAKATQSHLQKQYGEKIFELLTKIEKTNDHQNIPILPYGKSLRDQEFINLVKESILFLGNKNKDYIKYLNNNFRKYEKQIKSMFKLPQINKDIVENAILTILNNECKNENDKIENENNFKLIFKSQSSITPLIELNFKKDNKIININKKELKEILCSPILLEIYDKTLTHFIPDFKEKVKDNKDLIGYIINYINKYNIYFASLPKSLSGIIIHTGNIYIQKDFIKQYFEEMEEENFLIIREKIILTIKHELSNALIREIDSNKKDNFLIRSNCKDENVKDSIEFKNPINELIYELPKNESGNLFDYYFYNQYYIGNLFYEEAEFFSNIKKYKKIDEYRDAFDMIIQKIKKRKRVIPSSVNTFNERIPDEIPFNLCFFNLIRK